MKLHRLSHNHHHHLVRSQIGRFLSFLGFSINIIPMDASSGTREPGLMTGTFDRMAVFGVIHEYNLSRCSRISVSGYDTSLPKPVIRNALFKHFRPCGRICTIKIPGDNETEGSGFIYFAQKGALEKALALDGTDVGGWNVVVKALPKYVSKADPDHIAALKQQDYRFTHSTPFFIRGYDTSLPADKLKSDLMKHFSSCGEITDVRMGYDYPKTNVLKSNVILSIYGEDAVEKTLALNGTDVGGWKVLVEAFPKPERDYTPDPYGRVYGATVPDSDTNKTEITAEEGSLSLVKEDETL